MGFQTSRLFDWILYVFEPRSDVEPVLLARHHYGSIEFCKWFSCRVLELSMRNRFQTPSRLCAWEELLCEDVIYLYNNLFLGGVS